MSDTQRIDVDEVVKRVDALASRLEQLSKHHDETATGVWYDTEEHLPPIEEWLLTWWGPDNGLRVARLITRINGERYWIDWDGDPVRNPYGMPIKWARINVPEEG